MKSLITYLLLLISFSAFAQGWRQTFGSLLSPVAVCETPDGGAALLANSISGAPPGRQIVLSKVDLDGLLQWQKILGGAGDDDARDLILTAEGHLAVAGKIAMLANNGDALLALFQLNGQKIWERTYNFGVLDDAKSVQQMPDGGFILALEADNQLLLLRTDAQGLELWSKMVPGTQGLSVKQLTLRADGGMVVSMLRNFLPLSVPAAIVLQLDALGNLEFQAILPHFSNYVTTNQVRCVPTTDSTYWLMHRDSMYLLNADTQLLQRWQVNLPADFYLTDMVADDARGLFVLGTQYSFNPTAFSRTYFAHYQADGALIWQETYEAPSAQHSSWAAAKCRDGGFFLTGNYAKNGGHFSYLIRTDSLGRAFTNEVSGHVFWDRNEDCTADISEKGLQGWLLRLESENGELYYASTDSLGAYQIGAGVGEHRLSVLMPNGLWAASCVQNVLVAFAGPFQARTIDFPVRNTAFCPLPRVNAGVDYWLSCSDNTLVLQYANSGSAVAENAAITLTLDTLLQVTGATRPYTQIGPHAWAFPLGDLDPLADSTFQVSVWADCSADVLNRTLCATAEITPNAPCIAPLNGPLLIVEGACEGDSVRFYVRNIGLPMTTTQSYIVVEDDLVLFPLAGLLQLDAGEELELSFPANGATWRLEVQQASGVPEWLSDPQVAAVVEGCSVSGAYSTGFAGQFSLYDGGYFTEKECRPVVNQGQGIGKTAYPMGWMEEHLIQPNTDLEYSLQYQNTTTDTIWALTFRDSLDYFLLDPGSVIPGPASHPYLFDLSDRGVLTFRLMAALLPDSTRAWVKFRVSQQPNLPVGIVIYNHAWVYPDFAAPLPTGQTFHTIGQPLIVFTQEPHPRQTTLLRAWPQPSQGDLTIGLPQFAPYHCQIFRLNGQLVWEQKGYGDSIRMEEYSLPEGVYYGRVFSEGKMMGAVKIIQLKH